MFLLIQFPLCDNRYFLPTAAKLSVPNWPSPSVYNQFVRHFGILKDRVSGGVADWIAEDVICEAGNALKYASNLHYNIQSTGEQLLTQSLFKRFYSTGTVMSKFEFGFSVKKSNQQMILDKKNSRGFLSHIFSVKARIKTGDNNFNNVNFINSNKLLSRLYLNASTPTQSLNEISDWWVSPVRPLGLLQISSEDSFPIPYPSKPVISYYNQAIKIFYMFVPFGAQKYPMWIFQINGQLSDEKYNWLRQLRLYLFRIHSERECVREILQNISSGNIVIDPRSYLSDKFQYYLLDSTRRILKVEKNFPDSVATAAFEILSQAVPGQSESLLEAITKLDLRKNIYHQIKEFAVRWENITVNVVEGDYIDMSKKIEIKVDGNGKLDITGDLIIADEIKDSFNKTNSISNDDLRKLIQEMTIAVGEMSQQLSETLQKEVAQDLDILVTEAAKHQPVKRRWEFSVDGLKKAAQDVGEIGKPVLELAKRIVAVLALYSA